jgi:hypothetical protein
MPSIYRELIVDAKVFVEGTSVKHCASGHEIVRGAEDRPSVPAFPPPIELAAAAVIPLLHEPDATSKSANNAGNVCPNRRRISILSVFIGSLLSREH